jgi:hypothetical protein
MVAIGGVGLLLVEINAWKTNRVARAHDSGAVPSLKLLLALRALLGLLSLGSGYVINGYLVFGAPFANGILEHKPFGRDFIAPWLPLTVALNACTASLLPDLAIAFLRWKRGRRGVRIPGAR